MIAHGNKIKLFTGNGNKTLAQEIAKELHMPLGDMVVVNSPTERSAFR